jgi:hypothetical protein
MRLKALAAGMAATMVVGVGAGAGAALAADTSSVVGTYISVINGARWTLNINSNGTFNAASRGTGVSGRITLTANRANFARRKGCPVSAGVGAYSYNLVKKSLTFAVVKDPCTALSRVLKSGRWSRVS